MKNSTITLSKITQEIIRLKASFNELKSQQTQAGEMFTRNPKSKLNLITLLQDLYYFTNKLSLILIVISLFNHLFFQCE